MKVAKILAAKNLWHKNPLAKIPAARLILVRAIHPLFLALCLGAMCVCAVTGSAGASDSITVFAAASLKDALDGVDAAFAKQAGVAVAPSYGASSTLARQIVAGAPADVFISADTDWMDVLADKNLIIAQTRANLLGNTLVVIAPQDKAAPLSLLDPSTLAERLGADGRLAMGLTQSVPAGKYGKAALETLGQWASVKDRLAEVDNVRVALSLVARGEAALGIVYGSDALVENRVGVVAAFPEASHPKILYPVAAVRQNAGANAPQPAVAAYLAFLQSAQAARIFSEHGFVALTQH